MNHLKNIKKKAEYVDPQIRVNALRKKLNKLSKRNSDIDETNDDDNNNNDNNNNDDDSEDNQISNFVDIVLKKVSKEIVDDDCKNDDSKNLLKLSK